jgi:phytoene synthase
MEHAAAYAACARLAASHYENFPVASRLVPASMRPHIAAVYAFARTADDFADEDGREPADRIALLDDWLARLRAVAAPEPTAGGAEGAAERSSAGRAEARPLHEDAGRSIHEEAGCRPEGPGFSPARVPSAPVDPALIFEALGHTVHTCRLPVSLLEDLLSAFRQDVTVHRYDSWERLLDYCRRSANPVGRLVLRIGGYHDERLDAASDALCTALQLTNFWQDLAIDWGRGRLYVPLCEVDAASASTADLDRGRITPEWQQALGRSARRTRALFDEGRPVCDGVHGRLRYELRTTWVGATRILRKLEAGAFDVFTRRPTLGRRDALPIAAGVLAWRRGAGGLHAPVHPARRST